MTDRQTAIGHVSTRRVGDAQITIVHEGTGRWAPRLQAPEAEWRRAMPEADEDGVVTLDFNSAHIAIGDASIMVDCCFDDPAPNQIWESMVSLRRTPGLEAGLELIGVSPEDITHVVLSHPHGDHIAGATVERDGRRQARFPNARYLINRLDWVPDRGHGDPFGLAPLHLGALEQMGQLDFIDGDHEVVPGVTMVRAPGETAGHSIVRVESHRQTFYHLTDLFHFPCEVENADWVPSGCDAATAASTRRRIMADAFADNALLSFAHARFPGWGRLAIAPRRVIWQWD